MATLIAEVAAGAAEQQTSRTPTASPWDSHPLSQLDVHLQRLKKAVDDGDRPLIVGSAKELVEATARIVLEARGDQPASDEDFDVALNSAHSKLLFQRGDSIAVHDRVRDAGTNAKKLASQLGPLRNAYGTGHGRATIPAIETRCWRLVWTERCCGRVGRCVASGPTSKLRFSR